jgi:hypothetical protein
MENRPSRALGLSKPQIAAHLDKLTMDGFASGWERHPNSRYWRVRFEGGNEPHYTPWYSQSEISAWIDGAHSMGAAYP